MKCKRTDCFNCPYPDCINDSVKKEPTPEQLKRYRAQRSVYMKERREKRLEQGLCVECGKRAAQDGRKTCRECRRNNTARREANDYARGVHQPQCLLDGVALCKRCGKAPPKKGTTICEHCYEVSLSNLNKRKIKGGRSLNNNFAKGIDNYFPRCKNEKR